MKKIILLLLLSSFVVPPKRVIKYKGENFFYCRTVNSRITNDTIEDHGTVMVINSITKIQYYDHFGCRGLSPDRTRLIIGDGEIE